MSESANPLADSESAASAVLAALLKWQSGRINNVQLQAFVRETLASATPDLLHRFESCADNDADFRDVCSQLIHRLSRPSSGAENGDSPGPFPSPASHSNRSNFSATEALDIEFLPDLEEPVEPPPRRVFDPVMALQTVDGFIRFTTYDYLSVPRLIMAACIGAVCALPWIIENPEFSKDPGYNVYGPKPALLAGDVDSGTSQLGTASELDAASDEGIEQIGTEGQTPFDRMAAGDSVKRASSSDSILGPETEHVEGVGSLAVNGDAVEDRDFQSSADADGDTAGELASADSSRLDPMSETNDDSDGIEAVMPSDEPDLETLLAPYVDNVEVIAPQDKESELRAQILEQLHNRDFESVSKSLSDLAGSSDMKKWLSAEIALQRKGPEARLAMWRELLESPSTELLDDLLCARLLLTSNPAERGEFIGAARELSQQPSPDSVAARYIRWAFSWSKKRAGRDLAGEIARYASDQVSRGSVDAIFIANAAFAQSNVSEAYTQLVDSQITLQSMQPVESDDIAQWIQGESIEDLSERVRRTLNGLSGRLTTAPR